MSVNTVHETDDYSYNVDTLYGVSWFVRKRDDMVSLIDTGIDSELIVNSVSEMADETFNTLAETRTYISRWSED